MCTSIGTPTPCLHDDRNKDATRMPSSCSVRHWKAAVVSAGFEASAVDVVSRVTKELAVPSPQAGAQIDPQD